VFSGSGLGVMARRGCKQSWRGEGGMPDTRAALDYDERCGGAQGDRWRTSLNL
jgi:hypothetical protein